MWEATYPNKAALERDEPSAGTDYERLGVECRDQRALGRKLAQEIIASGTVGEIGHDFTIYLAGEARPKPLPKGVPIGGNRLSVFVEQQRIERPEVVVDDMPPAEEEKGPTSTDDLAPVGG